MQSAALKNNLTLENALSAETDLSAFVANAVHSFGHSMRDAKPFKHWLFENALSPAICHEIISLPIEAAEVHETNGKRDSHNELRRFFNPALQDRRYIVSATAQIFQSEPVVRAIEKMCDIKLGGSFLRIEYCQDVEGFWLEPHMDIKEKLITMQLYLNTDADAANLGTDMYDNDKKFHSSAPSTLGQGMAFVPCEPNSWHGFEKRPIKSVRRSLIVNYVTDDWRATHELAFPESPIAS